LTSAAFDVSILQIDNGVFEVLSHERGHPPRREDFVADGTSSTHQSAKYSVDVSQDNRAKAKAAARPSAPSAPSHSQRRFEIEPCGWGGPVRSLTRAAL
jgi:hypothetical protein